MLIEHKRFPLEIKAVEDDGFFSGYLSVFNNVDAYQEVVVPGAFKETLAAWKEKDALPPVLWQHDHTQPIGPFTKMEEDEHGLYVEGRTLMDIQRGREAHILMKNRVISGMSIGFETLGEEIDKEKQLRKLTKIKLWEGSIVTFPANPEAQIDAVKSILEKGNLPDPRTFERFLREAGFSKSQAVAITNHGIKYQEKSQYNAADFLRGIKDQLTAK